MKNPSDDAKLADLNSQLRRVLAEGSPLDVARLNTAGKIWGSAGLDAADHAFCAHADPNEGADELDDLASSHNSGPNGTSGACGPSP